MKRLGTTLAAAALTGAIAFAGVPASASEGAVPQETTTLGDRGTNDENTDGDRDKEDDSDRDRNEGETPYGGGSKSRVECADDEGATLNIKWGDERPESFEFDGNTWFKHEDGEHYVTDSANRDGELTEQDEFKSNQAAAKKFGYSCDYEGSDGDRDRNRDRDRERTPGNENNREDCESTENNGGNSGDGNNGNNNGENCETTTLGDRGMNAETGDNTVARVLFALAALSVLGAAAFGARRFFTA
ncbi:hypothetical protein AALI21_01400 [Corynebacteriaceae bacterium 6-324]